MKSVENVPLSDSVVTEISMSNDRLVVKLRLWDEGFGELEFAGVWAVEMMSPLGEDISHIVEDDSDPFLELVRARYDEDSEGFRCFVIHGGQPAVSFVKIVAEGVDYRSVDLRGRPR